MFILDDDTTDEELRNLEEYIIDNYIDMDIDVPEKLKERYKKLKELVSSK